MAQHPGDGADRRDRQSVFVHLVSLCAVIERGASPSRSPDLLRAVLARHTDFQVLGRARGPGSLDSPLCHRLDERRGTRCPGACMGGFRLGVVARATSHDPRLPRRGSLTASNNCDETTLRTATRCFDMRPTVTHVATHLSPIRCHLCPELRHARSDQDRVIVQRRSDEALDEPMGGSMCSVWRLLRRVREHAGGGPLVEITMADLPGAASDADAGSREYETSASPGSAGTSRRSSARVMSSTSGWSIAWSLSRGSDIVARPAPCDAAPHQISLVVSNGNDGVLGYTLESARG